VMENLEFFKDFSKQIEKIVVDVSSLRYFIGLSCHFSSDVPLQTDQQDQECSGIGRKQKEGQGKH
jgi:hypothetical protein